MNGLAVQDATVKSLCLLSVDRRLAEAVNEHKVERARKSHSVYPINLVIQDPVNER